MITLDTAAAVSEYVSSHVDASHSGSLPFTGSELVLYLVVGLAVVVSGFGLRALSGSRR